MTPPTKYCCNSHGLTAFPVTCYKSNTEATPSAPKQSSLRFLKKPLSHYTCVYPWHRETSVKTKVIPPYRERHPQPLNQSYTLAQKYTFIIWVAIQSLYSEWLSLPWNTLGKSGCVVCGFRTPFLPPRQSPHALKFAVTHFSRIRLTHARQAVPLTPPTAYFRVRKQESAASPTPSMTPQTANVLTQRQANHKGVIPALKPVKKRDRTWL